MRTDTADKKMKIITTGSGHPLEYVLYQEAEPIAVQSDDGEKGTLLEDTIRKIEQMSAFYEDEESGEKAGFAAPQVGLSDAIILVEQEFFDATVDAPPKSKPDTADTAEQSKSEPKPTILINPTWRPLDEEKKPALEGCLSVLDHQGIVNRFTHVELTAWLYSPEEKTVSKVTHQYKGAISSVLWQHEINHLEGGVYPNHPELKHFIPGADLMLLAFYLKKTGEPLQGKNIFEQGHHVDRLMTEWKENFPGTTAVEFVAKKLGLTPEGVQHEFDALKEAAQAAAQAPAPAAEEEEEEKEAPAAARSFSR